jgi:hypothetical protein
MALNPVSNTARTMPYSPQMTAGGGYTLPQHVFVPHPSLQALSSGHVPDPNPGGLLSGLVVHPALAQRSYPGMVVPTHGIRLANIKQSP